MARTALFEWRTPPPTSVDEAMAVYDDGSAVLAVRSPRDGSASVGSYVAHPDPGDLRLLSAAGPGPVVFDLLHPSPGAAGSASGRPDLAAVAERVAALARATPRAIVTFYAHATTAPDGPSRVTLLAIGAGGQAVEFELDAEACTVQASDATGQPIGWQPLPELPTGFVTRDAEGLGGVRRGAIVSPGQYGAIAFDAWLPPAATKIAITVAGWLTGELPDESAPGRFSAKTAVAPLA